MTSAAFLVVAAFLTLSTAGLASAAPAPNPAVTAPAFSSPLLGLSIGVRHPIGWLPDAFWGVNLQAHNRILSNATSALWTSPVRYVRWPGGASADTLDALANREYFNGGGYGTASTSAAAFVTWCRQVGCRAIVELPGEIDSPTTAAAEVTYFETTLRFTPAYFEIGNEPALWKHFGTPWSNWTSTQHTNASSTQYAVLVHAYVKAIRAVDPHAHIIGLPGVGTGSYLETTWISDTVKVNGPNLSAVAIHVYPAGSASKGGTLSQFYGTLSSHSAIANRVPADLAAIRAACPRCPRIQLFVTEVGSTTTGGGSRTGLGAFAGGETGATYTAAEVVQAMAAGVGSFDVFALEATYPGAWVVPGSGWVSAVGALYTHVLPLLYHYRLPTAGTGTASGLWIAAQLNLNATAVSLIAVNVDTATSYRLNLSGSGLPLGGWGTGFTWPASSLRPHSFGWLSSGPQSILVPAGGLIVVQAHLPRGLHF